MLCNWIMLPLIILWLKKRILVFLFLTSLQSFMITEHRFQSLSVAPHLCFLVFIVYTLSLLHPTLNTSDFSGFSICYFSAEFTRPDQTFLQSKSLLLIVNHKPIFPRVNCKYHARYIKVYIINIFFKKQRMTWNPTFICLSVRKILYNQPATESILDLQYILLICFCRLPCRTLWKTLLKFINNYINDLARYHFQKFNR